METSCQIVVKFLQKLQNTSLCILIFGVLGSGVEIVTITNPDMGNTLGEVIPRRIPSVLEHFPAKHPAKSQAWCSWSLDKK